MAQTYDIAHLQEQGQDMIIVPLESSFGRMSTTEQNALSRDLQACATSAGLRGTVALVWDAGGGRMGFLAPSQWHGFFSSINLLYVAQNINRSLSCG